MKLGHFVLFEQSLPRLRYGWPLYSPSEYAGDRQTSAVFALIAIASELKGNHNTKLLLTCCPAVDAILHRTRLVE
ncbi:hypothetical protein [Ferrimicrobium acidiphilum]|uniref:hypothetical protein n=1 Tax=Ferrimicrobium acidiphilum TaxID=121039 RepID=UPI001B80CAEE